MKTLTFEELAEKLEGKIWVKENLKRIYLDEGYNTKKMSTKTYVYLTETGEYKVSCNIQCDSQPWAWIKSQQDEIIERVLSEIKNTNEIYNIELVKVKINQEKEEYEVFVKENSEASPVWLTENEFYSKFNHYPEFVFANLPEIQKKEKPKAESIPVIKKTLTQTATPNFKVGSTVNHPRFGNGKVKTESDEVIEIDFEGEVKKLMKKFVVLTLVEND